MWAWDESSSDRLRSGAEQKRGSRTAGSMARAVGRARIALAAAWCAIGCSRGAATRESARWCHRHQNRGRRAPPAIPGDLNGITDCRDRGAPFFRSGHCWGTAGVLLGYCWRTSRALLGYY